MLTEALERARRLRPVDGKLPHVTGEDGRWQLLSPVEPEREALTGLPWTGGFVAGQLRLAGEHEAAAEVDRLLAPRADAADDARPRLPVLDGRTTSCDSGPRPRSRGAPSRPA